MPHQCVRCNTLYDDGATEILKGCMCGARVFFFIRKEKLERMKNAIPAQLNVEQRQQIEEDVMGVMGHDREDLPVVLDFESVHVPSPGKYELDLVKLFQQAPLIFKMEDGKYIIDVAESFERLRKRK
ncbi:MAG TPA: Zn-ribbon containing protein [Candidatus Nanoarchaeia archaeon]|nr:Zn-ribbon containing protein [Candidatus Nanoarchaeia archaeon]